MIAQTSLDNWKNIQLKLSERMLLVFRHIKNNGIRTNLQLSQELGIPLNCITTITYQLKKQGLLRVVYAGIDKLTGCTAQHLGVGERYENE